MNTDKQLQRALVFRLLTIIGLGLLAVIYFSPIWWVSLKAPQYPETRFPDGVRIHFHVNGVFNGCKLHEVSEIYEEEVMDCVHEMNTINHYIGMHPISQGAKYELMMTPYVFLLFGAMLVVFLFYKKSFWWVLPLGAIALPIGFLADFSYWLWWFGHNLHPWGAFTVKPFMPTVFGVGKVAQFTTYAYPHYGFGLMVLCSLCLLLALLIRRQHLHEANNAPPR